MKHCILYWFDGCILCTTPLHGYGFTKAMAFIEDLFAGKHADTRLGKRAVFKWGHI